MSPLKHLDQMCVLQVRYKIKKTSLLDDVK